MVDKVSVVFMIISTIICFGLPIGLIVYFYKKEKISISAVMIGSVIFIIFQLFMRLPLINFLNSQGWFIKNIKSNTMVYVLFLSVTAGVFEEVGRCVGFRYLLKNKLQWKNGIAYGIGHGGIESVLLVGMTYVSNLIFSLLINLGTFDVLVGTKLPQAAALKNTLMDTHSYMFLLGGMERVFTIAFHIALSIIVLEGVMKKQNKYLLYAVLIHALVDFCAAYNFNIFATEGFMFVTALISFRFIKKSKNRFFNIKANMNKKSY
ncbi:YhfC family glutamic-type intramembrane protease [Clostridium aestuarii]|uniref:YhfC family glutamic-type intramembrane protease n=1 Tax=Clostridium aestuarii TaxID=338193 RepID=A0ABT4D148_9CLOT|nr:YhfC family glutamic-type intramembrane protease [Clostridium aestuarii]MCY6484969.1 YhfC family glutamic-type intramembrane protease [Clostridium aestuarii]